MILKMKTKKYAAIQLYQPPTWELKAFGRKKYKKRSFFYKFIEKDFQTYKMFQRRIFINDNCFKEI